ncbi:hypothetical protein DUI87_14801 [Hirundo rustica rustica]|uniref:Uncharacterized protein n=1 Tax=Hirundo rustica rustica TaxID=333673 RepID=A0A3M0KB80_HIRRU|nr:hypothetical protein DUI87_14801 [Hirundo rustica rustica]
MFMRSCAVVNISEVADHQQHTLQLTSAAQGIRWFAYRETCAAHVFGFVVVDRGCGIPASGLCENNTEALADTEPVLLLWPTGLIEMQIVLA